VEGTFCGPDTRLIETFGWDGRGFVRLDRHLARMKASARVLGFACDPRALRAALPRDPGPAPLRLRLTLGRAGDVKLTSAPLPANPPQWRVAVARPRLRSDDPRLRHKTTERALYDDARAALPAGIDEAIFLNERGEVAEGTITSVFFDLGGGLMTPPLSSGCLPGCLRADLLDTGQAREAVLSFAALPRARLWLGNSLRGLIPAELQP
jgi:4-amino-4-deoxychorismate lyase